MYRALQCSEFRSHIKRLGTFSSYLISLQIHVLAGDTMNLKMFLKHSAFATCIIQISCSLCHQRKRVCVNKPFTSDCLKSIVTGKDHRVLNAPSESSFDEILVSKLNPLRVERMRIFYFPWTGQKNIAG